MRLAAAGAPATTVTVPRAQGAEPGPNPRRPGGAAKESLDLSSIYSNEGFLGSSNNVIPDRVDVVLSPSGDGVEGVLDLAARLGLESTGVSLPIAKPPEAITAPGQRADPRADRHDRIRSSIS